MLLHKSVGVARLSPLGPGLVKNTLTSIHTDVLSVLNGEIARRRDAVRLSWTRPLASPRTWSALPDLFAAVGLCLSPGGIPY